MQQWLFFMAASHQVDVHSLLALCRLGFLRASSSELQFNFDIHLSAKRLQQGAHFFREEPGHLGVEKKPQITLIKYFLQSRKMAKE